MATANQIPTGAHTLSDAVGDDGLTDAERSRIANAFAKEIKPSDANRKSFANFIQRKRAA